MGDITSHLGAAGSSGQEGARGGSDAAAAPSAVRTACSQRAPISAESANGLPVFRFPDTTRSCVNERWFAGPMPAGSERCGGRHRVGNIRKGSFVLGMGIAANATLCSVLCTFFFSSISI